MKCDIVIPVYNHIEWVNMCVRAIFANTSMSLIGKIYIIDDCSNKETKDGLQIIKEKYDSYIEIITNKKNQGFLKNCNHSFKITKSDYVLLLNSDCLLSNRAIEKMMNVMNKDNKIGLLCPIATKASNLSFSIKEGYNYQTINKLFEDQFSGKTFDACTVVGCCLMISRKCINKIGGFDEIYEKGYSEETDYQFKAMKNGFKAKVLIDTFVFHERRVSFGEDDSINKIREKHLSIFFKRWGKEYDALYKKYEKNNPIDYIEKNIKYEKMDAPMKVKLDGKNLSEQIEMLNNMIIDNYNVEIVVAKYNKKWNDYNTIFIPKNKLM